MNPNNPTQQAAVDAANEFFSGGFNSKPNEIGTKYLKEEFTGGLTTQRLGLPIFPTIALQVGDLVRQAGALDLDKPAYIVAKIDFGPKREMVYLQRPYITNAGFTSGGEGHYETIVYTGIEHFPVERDANLQWCILRREVLK